MLILFILMCLVGYEILLTQVDSRVLYNSHQQNNPDLPRPSTSQLLRSTQQACLEYQEST